jgi:hypothetical protein
VFHNTYPKRFDLSLELIDAAAGTDKVCHAASQLMLQYARRVFETANAENTHGTYLITYFMLSPKVNEPFFLQRRLNTT